MSFLIELIAGLSGLALCGFALWKYPVPTALALTAMSSLWDLLQDPGTPDSASGVQIGVTLHPLDIGCVALGVACLVALMRTRFSLRDVCWPAVLLLGLCVLNFLRGAEAFGLKPAGNYARTFAYLVFPVVAISSMGSAIRMTAEKLVTCLSLTALAFAAVAAARWAGVLSIPQALIDTTGDYRSVVRVLPSAHALIIGQALIGILGLQLLKGFRATGLVFAGLFGALVFALQHRSVWMATAAGLVWLAIRSPRVVRREWLKYSTVLLFMLSALALSSLVASSSLDRGIKLVRNNVDEVERDDSTWAWRVDGYTEATERLFSGGLIEMTIGPPTGADLSETASYASITIHDNYISVLVYYGIAGLVLMIVWLMLTAVRLHSLGRRAAPLDRTTRTSGAILEALFVSVVVYFVPYNGENLQGLVLGAIWLASATYAGTANRAAASPRQYRVRISSVPEEAHCYPGAPVSC